jgi:hypothetical protein
MCPDGGGQATFCLSAERIQQIQRFGPAWKFDNSRLLEEALQWPRAVFEGLERKGMEAAYCYSAKPSRRYRQGSTIEIPFSPDRVFVVCVQRMSHENEFEILDWAIREEDASNPGYPEGWQSDFGRQIWPKT